jgi:hypothetical protein
MADLPGEDLEIKAFSILKDLAVLQPGQSLYPDVPAEIAMKNGPQTLKSFVQTGEGIHPTHFLLDATNRPLFITAGLLSLALVEIA